MRTLADHFLRIDLRSLGAFRLLLALLLLADVALRRPHLEAFYSSFGILPIEASPEALPPRRVLLWSHDCFLGRSDTPAVRPPIVPDQSGEDSQTKRSGSPS